MRPWYRAAAAAMLTVYDVRKPAVREVKRLRLLIVGLNYAPELTGIGKYTGEMAAWLALRGHSVRVIAAPPYYPAWRVSDDYRGRGYTTEAGGTAGDGVGEPLLFRCPLYVPAEVSGAKRMLHLLSFALSAVPVLFREVVRGKPDLVWTVEPTFFSAPFVLVAARLARVPAWLHVQDFEIDAAFELGLLPSGGLTQRFATGLEGMFTRSFDRVSSISVRMVGRTLRKGVDLQRSVLFPNWVDTDLVHPLPRDAPNEFREALGLKDKVVFLYSGNMGNKQGLELLPELADAFRADSHVHFLFCGDGTFRPTLEAAVAGAANVTLLPLQPLDKLNALLNAADVHLLPQRMDAADLVMPSKLTGMLSSGRPTLATAEHGTQVATVVAGGANLHPACGVVVGAGNVEALIAAARVLANDAALRAELGSAARHYAVHNLGRDPVLQQFERDLYALCMEHGRRVR